MGDRKKYINTAIEELRKNKRIHVNRISSIYETEALSAIAQGKFLNGVLEIETDLTPEALLGELNAIEGRLGRKRIVKDGSRTIDLDILYYDDVNMKSHNLIIPHPKIREREFVLKGLRELGKA
ncbi:MAG: 2-amino-4-hydroxy-6-hydroxymethyldihydropteridine diphosphokinase [Candidatus Omnitrophica bacterium]|nr:2-amino-4-hydroxy-6-hydroxymethyldihydropteridine diphosphokinase [Candidatus Omnitrophota bacterium]